MRIVQSSVFRPRTRVEKVNPVTAIIEGVYKHGTIELLESLPGLEDGPVRVIVLGAEPPKPPACYLTFGKYRSGKMSTLEDFRAAEWHGEEEFDPANGQ